MSNIQPEIPDKYLCPITKELMTDPVIAADGQTYQRESITEWIRRGNRKSPLTDSILTYTILIDNITAKNIIRDFLEKHPEIESKGGIKPDLNLCIREREEKIKDQEIKIENIRSNSIDILQSEDAQLEQSKSLYEYLKLKEEYSKLQEEYSKLKNILYMNGLSQSS